MRDFINDYFIWIRLTIFLVYFSISMGCLMVSVGNPNISNNQSTTLMCISLVSSLIYRKIKAKLQAYEDLNYTD